MIQIIKYELKKVIQNKTIIGSFVVGGIILFGIFFVGYYYSQLYNSEMNIDKYGYNNMNDIIHEVYEGEFTDNTIKMIVADYIDVWQDEHETITDAWKHNFYFFYWDVATTFVNRSSEEEDIYSRMPDKVDNGERLSIDEISIKSIDDLNFKTFDKALTFGNYQPWTDLYKVVGNVYLLICVLVIMICSVIFSEDTSRNINQIIFTTKNGRSKLILSKMIVGTILSLGIFVIFQLINLGVFSFMYDTRGWSSNIQTNLQIGLFQFPLDWTHLQVFLLILSLQLVGVLFVASVTLFISAITSTPMTSLAVSLGIFIGPRLLTEVFTKGIIYKLLYLFPINTIDTIKLLNIVSFKESFLMNSFTQNILFIVGFLLVVKIVMDIASYQYMKRWKFK